MNAHGRRRTDGLINNITPLTFTLAFLLLSPSTLKVAELVSQTLGREALESRVLLHDGLGRVALDQPHLNEVFQKVRILFGSTFPALDEPILIEKLIGDINVGEFNATFNATGFGPLATGEDIGKADACDESWNEKKHDEFACRVSKSSMKEFVSSKSNKNEVSLPEFRRRFELEMVLAI